MLLAAVQASVLFKALALEHVDCLRIVKRMLSVRAAKGDVVVHMGDLGDCLYIVSSGVIRVTTSAAEGGGEAKHRILRRGASFGELALMYNAPRSATCLAEEACALWALPRRVFRELTAGSRRRAFAQVEEFLARVPLLASLTK